MCTKIVTLIELDFIRDALKGVYEKYNLLCGHGTYFGLWIGTYLFVLKSFEKKSVVIGNFIRISLDSVLFSARKFACLEGFITKLDFSFALKSFFLTYMLRTSRNRCLFKF